MKKFFVTASCAFLIFATTVKINAQTTVPGGQVYGTWTLAGSPYNVTGSVQVPNDSTLTIQAGVTVSFQGTFKIVASGRIIAIGTAIDTIFFTAANTAAGWRGIDYNNTAATNDTSRFSFCSFRYGKATGSSPDDDGGAFYFNTFSKAVISNCRISDCSANSYGGAMYLAACDARVINNRITNNTAPDAGAISISSSNCVFAGNNISYNTTSGGGLGGGLIISTSGTAIINNNTINYNSSNGGGAMRVTSGCTPQITNNNMSYNTTTGAGGAMYVDFNIGAATLISGNIISYNVGANVAGGIYCANASPTINYNLIANNTNNSTGFNHAGGIFFNNSNSKVSNNVFANNHGSEGGAIRHQNSNTAVYTNNTFVNNTADKGGAIYCNGNSDPTIRNCIFKGNTATNGNQLYANDDNSDPNFYYCDVEGGSAAFDLNGGFFTGTFSNCINSNPLFVSPSGGTGIGFNGVTADWSLQNTSPCIDTGDPTYSPYPATDVANNPRVTVCRIDMGAYEYQSAPPLLTNPSHTDVTCFNACNGTAAVNPTGGSGSYTYQWMPGNILTQSVSNLCNATYTVTVTESGGCSSSSVVTITQPSAGSTSTVSICMATVDSLSQNNVIYWDKTTVPLADTFLIYRDTANNNYALIGKVPYDSLSQFVDTVRSLYAANGDPNASSWRYKIAVYDTCGNIGAKSPYHQTMFFQHNTGNFNWSPYQIEGQTTPIPALSNYLFKRDDISTGIWNTIQTLSASSVLYTDANYSTYQATGSWRVETSWSITCNPTLKINPAAMAAVAKSRSNVQNNFAVTGIKTITEKDFVLMPNPANDIIVIQSRSSMKNVAVEIYDLMGKLANREQAIGNSDRVQINTSNLNNGIYTVRISSENGKVMKKLVIEK